MSERNKKKYKPGDMFVVKSTESSYSTIVTILEIKDNEYTISWWNQERTSLIKAVYSDHDVERYIDMDEWDYYPAK